jgi:hypothetical protein
VHRASKAATRSCSHSSSRSVIFTTRHPAGMRGP